jgi:hypothetical protein
MEVQHGGTSMVAVGLTLYDLNEKKTTVFLFLYEIEIIVLQLIETLVMVKMLSSSSSGAMAHVYTHNK